MSTGARSPRCFFAHTPGASRRMSSPGHMWGPPSLWLAASLFSPMKPGGGWLLAPSFHLDEPQPQASEGSHIPWPVLLPPYERLTSDSNQLCPAEPEPGDWSSDGLGLLGQCLASLQVEWRRSEAEMASTPLPFSPPLPTCKHGPG